MGKRKLEETDNLSAEEASRAAKRSGSAQLANEKENFQNDQQPSVKSSRATMSLPDLLELEHAVSTLQSSIKVIIDKAPNKKDYKQIQANAFIDNPQLAVGLERSRLKLSSKLKTLYQEHGIKLFDQILNYQSSNDDDDDLVNVTEELNLSSNSANASKSPLDVPAKTGKYPPPLPEIKNIGLRARVFLHKSTVNSQTYISQAEALESHNERLEFLGDSLLGFLVTKLIFKMYPNANEGDLSTLRSKLVRNSTLEDWAYLYGFEHRLRADCENNKADKGKKKRFADAFEAYIGALYLDNCKIEVIENWLKELSMPILRQEKEFKDQEEPIEVNAKQTLYSLIGFASLGIHYEPVVKEITPTSSRFVVELRIKDGTVLASGEGHNIKEAGARAAMNALKDKELIEKYSRIRAATPRSDTRVKAPVEENDGKSTTTSLPSNNENVQEKPFPKGPKNVPIPTGPSVRLPTGPKATQNYRNKAADADRQKNFTRYDSSGRF